MSTNETSATPIRKFMFERSFDDAAIIHRAAERKPVLMKPEQIDALKKESHDAGFEAGKAAMKEEQDAQLAKILDKIDHNISILVENLAALAKEQEEHIRRMALSIAKKILPSFTAQNGTQEIETLVNSMIQEMAREPRLVVRVHETGFDRLNERIQEIATRRAYPGKVIVLADNEIASGDCRIEWADGGVSRDTQKTMTQIEQTILPQ